MTTPAAIPVMTIGEALVILQNIEALLEPLQKEYDTLMGDGPRGPIGQRGFSSLQEVLEVIRSRESQILVLKQKIHNLKHESKPAALRAHIEINRIAARLGVL